jgi:hypothetical protein
MEKRYAYDKIKIKIELIDRFQGGNQECTIFFSDKMKKKYALCFDPIFDFRYAIENAFIDRLANWAKTESGLYASICEVEDSDYLKCFEYQCSGTFPTDGIRHFTVFDAIDTGIEVLTSTDPVLYEMKSEPDGSYQYVRYG